MLKRASKQKPEADKIDEVNRETEEKKQDELDPAELRRTKWQLDESQLEEVFTRGWGHGGQCVNRTRNAVILQHLPSGEIVRCHETRSLQRNREIARKRMIERLDNILHGDLSKAAQQGRKLRQRKQKRQQKSRRKSRDFADSLAEQERLLESL
ncbi:MAG: hypothetical protein MHM6MM_008806 [Cercozoa sp. M6MM]